MSLYVCAKAFVKALVCVCGGVQLLSCARACFGTCKHAKVI